MTFSPLSNFKRDAFDNAELIHLWIEYEDEDSFPDIYGYAYYKRKSSKPDSGVDDDIYSRVSGDISELINNRASCRNNASI